MMTVLFVYRSISYKESPPPSFGACVVSAIVGDSISSLEHALDRSKEIRLQTTEMTEDEVHRLRSIQATIVKLLMHGLTQPHQMDETA